MLPVDAADVRPPAVPQRPRRVAIVQSNYIPWKGYFDLIAGVDVFVLYDDAQYTKRDWRNRNRIKTPQGLAWLTIPVQVSGRYQQRIRDVQVSEPAWADAHWRTLALHYHRASGYAEVGEAIERLYRDVPSTSLSDINEHFIRGLCALLGITTPLRRSSEFTITGDRSEKLLAVCRQLDAGVYVSGPAARDYLDERLFGDAGIAVEWMDYSGYPAHRQLHPPFEHGVSVVDLLMNEGRAARSFMKTA